MTRIAVDPGRPIGHLDRNDGARRNLRHQFV